MLSRPSLLLVALAIARPAAGTDDDPLAAALDTAREAIAINREMKSSCQKRLAVKLRALEDTIEDMRGRPSAPAVAAAFDRVAAATALLEDKCPARLVQAVGRSLDDIAAHLRAALSYTP